MSQVNPVQLQKYLSGVDYPCDRDELVQAARNNGADTDVLDALRGMPDRTFNGPNAVSEAVT
ncbi:DUF2795 domain-containing protein [Nocardia otitidiscaviarum]|uniref:DUF2795 domain-containing protein n=1 Tax=Nocardia otitidiscaviarum TaxID=1823 RepID=UPI0004A709B3|nr:DUF2795 domain-containing protein [Nocardia otitidiscaviarum]MBF6135170.1 DUF2795 domain-containing protein [Nocardia otitidiscaviarum]MBF6486992.1 DUF2795 domain-containing protein [Nocardia otitidiscaviarum]